jgi:hypothetical protein
VTSTLADGSLVTTAPAYITETLVITDGAGHAVTETKVIENPSPTLYGSNNGDPSPGSKLVNILSLCFQWD